MSDSEQQITGLLAVIGIVLVVFLGKAFSELNEPPPHIPPTYSGQIVYQTAPVQDDVRTQAALPPQKDADSAVRPDAVIEPVDPSDDWIRAEVSRILADYGPVIKKWSAFVGYPWELTTAIILRESEGESCVWGIDPHTGHRIALGLMQLMPSTAHMFGVGRSELCKPGRNIYAGLAYLQYLKEEEGMDTLDKQLLAYRFGVGGAHDQYLNRGISANAVPYVQAVEHAYGVIRAQYAGSSDIASE